MKPVVPMDRISFAASLGLSCCWSAAATAADAEAFDWRDFMASGLCSRS